MENVCLFDVLNGGFQSKLVSSNNVLNCNLNNDVLLHDLYFKFDLRRFTVDDSVEQVLLQLEISTNADKIKFSLFETNDYNLDSITKLSDFDSVDISYNENYLDSVVLTNTNGISKVITFDLTKLFNKKIRLGSDYVSFRIYYHDKGKLFTLKSLYSNYKSTIFGFINKFNFNQYDKVDMGNIGTSNISLYNNLLKLNLPTFDSGNKIIPIAFSGTYHNTYHSKRSLLGDFFMSNFEYDIIKNDDYIRITNHNLERKTFHHFKKYDDMDEAYYYRNYMCAENEYYYSHNNSNEFISLLNPNNNIQTLRYINNNVMYIFDYYANTNKVYLKEINIIKDYNNLNNVSSDRILFNWSSTKLLNNIQMNNSIIFQFSYGQNNTIEKVFIPNNKMIISLSYNNSSEGYITIRNIKVYKSSTNSITGLTPFINNNYTFDSFYGTYKLRSVYDNINKIGYKFTYPFTYTNDLLHNEIIKIEETTGLQRYKTYSRQADSLNINTQYNDIKKYYFDDFNNNHLVIDKYNRYNSIYYNIKYNGEICDIKSGNNKNGTVLLNNCFDEVENGVPKNWVLENGSNEDQILSNTYLPEIIGNNVFKIKGSSEIEKVFSQDVSFDIINDSFETWQFSLWFKCQTTINQITKINVLITNTDNTTDEYDFYLQSIVDNFQVFSGNFESKKSFKNIKFSVIYKGFKELFIGNIRLYKLIKNSNYDINNKNQIESINLNGSIVEYIYDEFNRIIKAIGSNGDIYNYEYNNRNNVILIYSSQTKEKIEYSYDENENLISYVYTTVDGKTNTILYDYDNNELIRETDINGNQINYTYTNGNVNYQIDSCNNKISYEYYNDLNNVKKRTITNNNIIIESYNNTYDTNNRIESIETNNLNIYNFLYDTYNRLELVDSSYYTLIELMYTKINNFESDLIHEERFNTGYYRYTYDSRNRLEYIKLVLYTVIDCYKFEYDNLDRVVKIIDYINNIEKEFIYDEDDNVVRYVNKLISENSSFLDVSCFYDNTSQLQKKNICFNNTKNSYEYDYINEYNTFNSNSFVLRFVSKNTCDYILGRNINLAYGQKPIYSHVNYEYDEDLKQYVINNNYLNGTITYDTDYINAQRRNFRSYNGTQYNKNDWESKFNESKCMYGYFKIDSSSEFDLMFLSTDMYRNFSDPISYQLRIDNDLKLAVYKGEYENIAFPNYELLFKTNLNVELNKWNLIGIKYDKNKIIVYYNGSSYEHTNETEMNWLNFNKIGLGTGLLCIDDQDYYINEAISNNIVNSCKIICFCIDNEFAHSESYLEGNKYLNNNFKINSSSKVSYYNKKIFDNNIDVISLNGNFNSVNNLSPYIKTHNLYNYKDKKNKLFEYDSELGRIVFGNLYNRENGISNGAILGYRLGLETTGSICLMFKLDSKNILTDRYIISSYNENNELKMGIYLTTSERLVFKVGNVSRSVCYIDNNKWYTLALTWNVNGVNLYLDNQNYSIDDINIDLSDTITYLASKNDGSSKLNGYLQMLVFSSQILSNVQINDIYNDGIIEIKNNYDVNGRIYEKKLSSNKCIINKQYTYDNINNKLSKLVKTEKLFNEDLITYTYDNYNNIINKVISSGNTDVQEVYIYDSVNRLISEEYYGSNNILKCKYNYTYDTNGNVLTKEKVDSLNMQEWIDTYVYSEDVPDLLVEVKNKCGNTETTKFKLEYDYSLYPHALSKNGIRKTLEWECNKLTKFGEYTYKYNESGQRTKKVKNNGDYVNFYYEGSTIYCTEHKEGNEIKYLYYHYDENGILTGLSYNNNEYVYERDVTGNIINILDLYGKPMVKYTYTSYGVPTKSIGVNLSSNEQIEANDLKDLNIYLYKGYVYDEETGLFWLSSRYYSPELCRFISPDDIEYLDPESVNGLNLYCYCLNNPIMYADPSGHAPQWLQTAGWIGLGVGILICGVAIGILTAGVGTATFLGAVAVGAAKGALIGAAIGVGVGAIAGGAGAMISGEEFGSSEFWSDVLYGGMLGFGVGAVIGAVAGGVHGANGWYNAKALEFTNVGSNEVVLGRSPGYVDIARSRGATYFHTTDDIWNATQSMRGVGSKGMWRINKAFLKQQIKAGARFTLADPTSGYFYAKEVAYVMKYGVYAFL